MKRLLLFVFVLFILIFTMSADEGVWWGSNYMPGNLALKGALGFEQSTGSTDIMALSVYPEAEIFLYKPHFGGISPMDFGIASRNHIGFGFSESNLDSNIAGGLGVFGTFHFGFRGIGSYFTEFQDTPSGFFSQLNKFDYFFEAGPVFDLMTYDNSGLIGFGMTSGINYFINDNMAVTLEGNWWHGFAGGGIGFVYKIGPSPNISELDIKIKSVDIDLSPMYMQIYLSQFYSIYWYSFYAGGFYFDDSNYKEGQGTEWRLTTVEDNDGLIISKALLKVNNDESRWWQVKSSEGEDGFIYEFLLDKNYNLLKLKFIDEETNEVREYIASKEDLDTYRTFEMRGITDSDYKDWSDGTVEIKTQAGKFTAEHLLYTENDLSFEWWISDKVPGTVVKYMWKDANESMTGELLKISSKNKTELNSY